jgi:hypothetical protein
MPTVEFESTTSAGERTQANALDFTDTGTALFYVQKVNTLIILFIQFFSLNIDQ